MPGLEPVYKVTILPRGRTGGHALVVPEDDKSLMTRSEMIARLVMAMGGRAAEELVFAEPTTGASSDIAQATKIARAMVTEYGMSAKLGAVKYGHGDDEPFLGRTYGSGPEYSIEVGSEIDGEVRALIEAAHTEAWAVLNTYRDILDSLASALLEKETLDRRDLRGDLRRGREAAADHHLRRVRPAAAVRPAADQDAGRARHRARRAVAAAGVAARAAGRSSRSRSARSRATRGRAATTPVPATRRSAAARGPAGPGPSQAPPNWTGGVLPGPLAPLPGWQPGPDRGRRAAAAAAARSAAPNGGPNGGQHAAPYHGRTGRTARTVSTAVARQRRSRRGSVLGPVRT